MVLRYTNKKEDYFHFSMYLYDRDKKTKDAVKAGRLALAVLLLCGTFEINRSQPYYLILSYVMMWGLGITLIIFAKRIHRKLAARRYQKLLDGGSASDSLGYHTMELEEDVFTVTRELWKLQVGYKKLTRVLQSEYAIYMYYGSRTALLVPLTAFTEAGQKEAFLQLLKDKRNKQDEQTAG